jgi:hypothetical protein
LQQNAKEHPAVKVITLLKNLQVQVKEEGQAETHAYGKFTYWCGETIKAKTKAVKQYDEEIAVSTSQIQALTEDIAALEKEVETLAADITADEAAKTSMKTSRDEDNSVYMTNKGDLEATVSAIEEAIKALEGSKPAFLQQKAKDSPAVKEALALLSTLYPKNPAVAQLLQVMQEPIESEMADKFEGRTGREATYDFKGGDVIELLKKLTLDFEDQLTELTKAEANAANAHTLADAAKDDEIAAATRAKDTKEEVKGAKGQDLSTAESNLDEATKARDADQTVLDETKMSCRTRADEFDLRTKTRAGEIEAMGQAIEVLEKITGVRTPESKGITASMQMSAVKKAINTKFLQLSAVKKSFDPKAAIVNLLRKAGSKKQTAALAKLADKIAALKQTPGSGVFDQIKNMIEKMIFHLMSEQTDEDNHKNWCDKELETTTIMQGDKNSTKERLQASIDELSAEIESLGAAIKENAVAIAEIDAMIEEETGIRAEAKAENEATIKDAESAQTAISQAIAVLEEFYKSTGEVQKESWELIQKAARRTVAHPELLQQPAGEAEPEPELWESKPYTGTEGGSAVIGMLTNIATDFASMEAEARSDETTQQDQFDEDITHAKIDKSEKEKDSEMKTSRMERMKEKLVGKNADFKHNQKELDATNQYWKDLQHACVDGDSTYEDRKAARTQEIQALRDAQGILEKAFEEPAAEGEGSPAPA